MTTFCYTINWDRRVGHPDFNVPAVLKLSKDDPRLTVSPVGGLTWGPHDLFDTALQAVEHEINCQTSEFFQNTLKRLDDADLLIKVNVYAIEELRRIRSVLKAG